MMKRLFLSLVLLSAQAFPAWALDLNPLSAIKGAVEAAVEDRSSQDIANDLSIKTKITAEVIDKMGSEVISINADVYEGQVMLTGAVDHKDIKEKAGMLTKGIKGVKRLFNEIMVIKPIDKDKGAVENYVDDTVIESKINALLLDGGGVNVTNFRWRSVGGHVFLFGRALSAAEKDKAAGIVAGIKGVRSLTNRVFVRAKS
ncbi:MAG: BON domain-containing protein [Methylocystaceae bacterium]|nr:BON domain-containing protein [Methylocystaceae bacterium]